MRIEIIGRNYNVPDRLKSVIERKFEKLNKYFDKKETESKLSSYIEKDGAVAKFVCTQEKNRERYTLEATIYFGDRMIRAEETSENIYDNVDVVIPMLERQMRKVRTKIEKSYKSHDNGAISDDFADVPDLPELKPVRTKEFELKPLTVDAAIDQLTILDHDFFLYLNPETGKVNVVYKRHKGDVGVIECIY